MAKDTFYFSHDYNSRNDVKIKRLIAKHGFLGYGVFWAIVEELYNNANALPKDYETISYDFRCDKSLVESIINDFDLFVFEGDLFGSMSVQKRLEARNEKSVKARESALSRWKRTKKDANALQSQSDGNAIKESKGNEIKGNDNTNLGSQVETFFNDLPNSTALENTAKQLNVTKQDLLAYLNQFRKTCKPIYENFGDFVSHFKNSYSKWLKTQNAQKLTKRNQLL